MLKKSSNTVLNRFQHGNPQHAAITFQSEPKILIEILTQKENDLNCYVLSSFHPSFFVVN